MKMIVEDILFSSLLLLKLLYYPEQKEISRIITLQQNILTV